jgi:putative ABC transport system permease protein
MLSPLDIWGEDSMFAAALRDLVWRRRRFAIALIATALVMSMSLVMSGLSQSFPNEINRMLDTLDADQFIAAQGATGPFYPGSMLFTATAPEGTDGLFFASAAIPHDGDIDQFTVLGVEPGGIGEPIPQSGARIAGPGETVLSSGFGFGIGDTVEVAGSPFRVVGTLGNVTLFGGQPVMFIPITDAQRLFAGSQPVATFLMAPAGTDTPDGLRSFTRDEAFEDLIRPLDNARASILFVTILLWIVAACIVGSVVFLQAMERTRDFAVFKATGASTGSIGGGLMLQAAVLAVAASLMAIVLALILAPFFPMPVEIPAGSMVRLPLIAVVVGMLASLAGLRRVLSVPPSMAFGGAQ